MINDFVIELPWEERWEDALTVGPINDYIEVIDIDPAAGLFYAPVDLNHPHLLAQDGLEPSEGRPQFHQQMVFAVAMRTIRAFEHALGRTVLWARDPIVAFGDKALSQVERNFTKRLRIHPHALREANAYYSPAKRALLFGYFHAVEGAADVQARWVFTCLSQDIVAHETTHAILHGMRQRSIEPSNPDAMAFHEAFADIIALLQHFSMTGVVRHMLQLSHGSLRGKGLLTGLGDQFGRATGRDSALRYALEILGEDAWTSTDTSAKTVRAAAERLQATTEPHARGGFLVAAVFDAFVTIYERRGADLFRLARADRDAAETLNPDLVARLAKEAGAAATQVMAMCVRALDYVPPADLRFGEYLRAIITADTDLVPSDPLRYRIAFVEAFKRWGITVPGCISMAPDSLLWDPPRLEDYPQFQAQAAEISPDSPDPADALSVLFTELLSQIKLGVTFQPSATQDPSSYSESQGRNLRDLAMQVVLFNQQVIHAFFASETPSDEDWETLLGLRLIDDDRVARGFKPVAPMHSLSSKRSVSGKAETPSFEVTSARISRRFGPLGHELHLLIIELVQKRRGYFAKSDQLLADAGGRADLGARWDEPDFWFHGGATLHVDLRDGRLLRAIRKRIDKNERLEEERAFRCGETTGTASFTSDEPFAFLHRSA